MCIYNWSICSENGQKIIIVIISYFMIEEKSTAIFNCVVFKTCEIGQEKVDANSTFQKYPSNTIPTYLPCTTYTSCRKMYQCCVDYFFRWDSCWCIDRYKIVKSCTCSAWHQQKGTLWFYSIVNSCFLKFWKAWFEWYQSFLVRRTLPVKRQNFTHFKSWSILEG